MLTNVFKMAVRSTGGLPVRADRIRNAQNQRREAQNHCFNRPTCASITASRAILPHQHRGQREEASGTPKSHCAASTSQ